MTLQRAREIVRQSDVAFADVVEAAAVIVHAPDSTADDLTACLRHAGLPAEFATMELARRQSTANAVAGAMAARNASVSGMSLDEISARFPELHRKVTTERGRVEIYDDRGAACILISREELEALEQALEILANTSEVRRLAEQIAPMVAPTVPKRSTSSAS